jgi:iron(III) transport system permease protein
LTVQPRTAAAWAVAAVLVGVLIGWPLARLLAVVASDPDGARAAVTGPGFATAVRHTVVTSVGTTVLAVPGGALLALVTARPGLPGRRTLQAAILLPLLVPPFVLGYSWTQAYGVGGYAHSWFGVAAPGLFGPVGIVVVSGITLLPFSYFIVSAGLATREEPDLQRAARVFGAGWFTTLHTVTLPLLRAPLGAASALIFVSAVESFAVPASLGMPAGYDTMTTLIYRDLALASDPGAFTEAITLAVALVLLAALVLWPAERAFRPRREPLRRGFAGTTARRHRGPADSIGRVDRIAAAVTWCYVVLAVGVPLAALALAAVTPAVGASAAPANWTLQNFRDALAGPTEEAIAHSLQLAVVCAVALVAMGLLVAQLARARAGVGVLVTLGYALPGSALAAGVMLAFGRFAAGTLAIIALAYLAKLWPLAHRPLAGVLDRLDADHARAARISGAGPTLAWRAAVLPSLAPALGGAAAIVALAVLHELTISSLLYGPASQTLAVVVLNAQQLGDVGVTAALAVLMTGVVLVLAVGVGWLLAGAAGRRRAGWPVAVPEAGVADAA